MTHDAYTEHDNIECSDCGLEVKVVEVDGDFYNVCGCINAVKIGVDDKHWIPDSWK